MVIRRIREHVAAHNNDVDAARNLMVATSTGQFASGNFRSKDGDLELCFYRWRGRYWFARAFKRSKHGKAMTPFFRYATRASVNR
jgi:hypothetical protein